MGVLLQQLKAWDNAAEYYARGSWIARLMRDTSDHGRNRGRHRFSRTLDQGDTARAMVAFDEAVRYRHSGLGDRVPSIVLGNMGIVHSRAGRNKLADSLHLEPHWQRGWRTTCRIMALKGIGGRTCGWAIEHGPSTSAIGLWRSAGPLASQRNIRNRRCALPGTQGRRTHQEALAMFELSVQMKDSLRNAEGSRNSGATFERKRRTVWRTQHNWPNSNRRTIAELRSERIRNRSWATGANWRVVVER
ncbi:MAG: hypothetical protein IPI07_04135 [Flavobacteriales bacterium]|nr:hypothetical protein [Flavobacteriales bacterium]